MKHSLNLGPKLEQKMTQKLALTPSLRQALNILQLANLELVQRIETEVLENPLVDYLEYENPGENFDKDLGNREKQVRENDFPDNADHEGLFVYKQTDVRGAKEGAVGTDLAFENTYSNSSKEQGNTPEQFISEGQNQKSDQWQQFIEGGLAQQKGLKEHLEEQVPLNMQNALQEEIAYLIISMLDDRGFLSQTPRQIAAQSGKELAEVERVLQMIQLFDPVGLAVSDIQESLYIQAKDKFPNMTILHLLISDYLYQLDRLDQEALARELDASTEQVSLAMEALGKLHPYPAYRFSSQQVQYIVPDLAVNIIDGTPMISVKDNWLPKIQLKQEYQDLLKKKDKKHKLAEKDFEYLLEKKESAQNLIWSIEQRRKTLHQVMEVIVQMQIDFFLQGPKHLKPLTMQEVGDKIGKHISSISRAVSGKYVATDWGVYEMKAFFPRALAMDQGEDAVRDDILRRIRDLIEQEEKPLTDSTLAEILTQSGVKIARRTVAKYRESMGIATASKRKKKKSFQTK